MGSSRCRIAIGLCLVVGSGARCRWLDSPRVRPVAVSWLGCVKRRVTVGAVERFHERVSVQRDAKNCLADLEGAPMKAGQLFSMVDAAAVGGGELSPNQEALTRLQADAPPMESGSALEVLETDLGRPASAVFAVQCGADGGSLDRAGGSRGHSRWAAGPVKIRVSRCGTGDPG